MVPTGERYISIVTLDVVFCHIVMK